MRKQINMTKLRGLLVLFLALVPTISHSENKPEATRFNPPVQEARKLTVDEQLEVAKDKLDIDQHTLLNLQKIDPKIYCLAQNNFFEASNEPFKGKVAVAEVVKNRTKSENFPDDVCGVIRQSVGKKCQFSWYCTGARKIPLRDRSGNIRQDVMEQWSDSVAAAMLVYHNKARSVTKGATHFYATRIGRPSWSKGTMVKAETIGDHTFLKPTK